jgi:hypothetical protein
MDKFPSFGVWYDCLATFRQRRSIDRHLAPLRCAAVELAGISSSWKNWRFAGSFGRRVTKAARISRGLTASNALVRS